MMQTLTKRFLCLALLLPFQVMIAQTETQSCVQVDKAGFVYLSTEMRKAVECLHRMLPNHTWSPEFKDVCNRIAKDDIAAPAEQAEVVVVECLNLLDGNNCAELQEAQNALKRYDEALRKGDATIVLVEDAMITRACGSCNTGCNTDCNTSCNSKCIKYKGTKAFCNLFAQDLQVPGSGYIANLTTNSFRVTGNAVISGDLTVDGTIFTDESITFEDLVVENLTVNGIFTTNGPVNMGIDATADDINIGTGGAGRIVNIGNDLAGSVTTITGDTSQIILGNPADSVNVTATGAVNIDGTTTLDLNASAGPINIGNDAVVQNINIGTGAAAKTIIVGNNNGATSVAVVSGTGDVTLQSTDDIIINSTDDTIVNATGDVTVDATSLVEINASAGPINIGNDAVAQAINIGTGFASRTITIGNLAIGSNILLNSGTGLVRAINQGTSSMGGSTTATYTPATRIGRSTFTGFTTANGVPVNFTINDVGIITSSSHILVTVTTDSATGFMGIQGITLSAGTMVVHTINNGAAFSLTDVISINFWVVN